MTLRRATERLREVGSHPVLLIALLIAMSGDLSAQDRSRSRSNDSSDRGGRTAVRVDSPSRPSSSAPSTPPRSASPSSPSAPTYDSPSSSPSRRRAVPGTPGDAHRQPPSRDRRDPDWRDRDGRGWYGHGHYYPRWYRYYGGPSWWWTPYGYWGWWWLGDNYWPYDPYYYEPYHRGRGYYERDGEVGALDLDVSPGRTQVYLDGQYLGTVDQYDGFPTYLWLDKGTYDLALYLDGYKTVAKQISIYPGTVIDVNDRLEPGQSVRPEDLGTKTHERRDARESFERERRERIERGEDSHDEDGDWRDRVRRSREDRRDRGEEIEIEDDDTDGRGEQGRVVLEVEPDDASVYLDGRFVGTAQDLAQLRRGLLVEPGKHNVAVVRPGRESVEREFEVDPGEELELEIELEPSSR